MSKKPLSLLSIHDKLHQLTQEKTELESQRDQALLKLFHECGAPALDPLTLAGVLLDAVKTARTNSTQKESWRSAGEKFLLLKKQAKPSKAVASSHNKPAAV